jgi:uncharacterized protein YodC (DUF2158 family)
MVDESTSAINTFRCGDIVSLRSGGVHMTVSDTMGNSVMCQWYNAIRGTVEKETFFFPMLRPGASAPQSPLGVNR